MFLFGTCLAEPGLFCRVATSPRSCAASYSSARRRSPGGVGAAARPGGVWARPKNQKNWRTGARELRASTDFVIASAQVRVMSIICHLRLNLNSRGNADERVGG